MMAESIGIGSGVLMLLCFPINFYVIYTRLEQAEDYLKFSTFIVMFKYRFGVGRFGGRLNRLFAIALVILMPQVFQWRYLVLVEDVKRIPMSLKLWIVVPYLLTLSSIAGMALSWLMTQ
jgi:hypothetical protein